ADVEDEGPGVAGLHPLAVDPRPEVEAVGVGDLGAVGDAGPDRRERLARLARRPLGRDELEVARAHVVDDRVAPDVVERLLARDDPGGPADHHAELDLPVELRGAARPQDRLARVEDRGWPLRGTRGVPLARGAPPWR